MANDSFEEILRIQQAMSQRIMAEQQVDRKIDLLDIVNELTDAGRRPVQTEAVLIEASLRGIPERDAISVLDSLERDRLVLRKDGFVERS